MSVPSWRQAFPVWTKIGLLSFGGPAGQIALMQDEIVTRRGWVAGESFDRGLAFSMMLPGPEAQQLATWLGWRLHGVVGGLIAGLAFIVPGAALMVALAWLAAAKGDVPIIAAIFAAIQPVAIALVIAAMRKLAGRAIKQPAHWVLALAAFVALVWFDVPFPLVVAVAAFVGVLLPGEKKPATREGGTPVFGHAFTVLVIAVLVLGAVFAVNRWTHGAEPFDDVAALFTTAALVTFGGAYAVLPFVADQAVDTYGWLDAAAMLNGLAIAEATPGPLILVNTYAGFFAGWSEDLSAWAGVHTAVLATIYTFGPSFALILAFAPAVERLQDIAWARRALAGISAAVVGVIAKLVIYLAEAAFIPVGFEHAEWGKLAILAVALVLVFVFRWGMLALVAFGICAGLALYAAGGT